jgi:uncharacterized protein with PhoU and TrkA domain
MSIVAVRRGERLETTPTEESVLPRGTVFVVLGSFGQRRQFAEAFERTTTASARLWWQRSATRQP